MTTQTSDAAPSRLEPIALELLASGENPRLAVDVDGEAFTGLVESIKQEGVITPILVGPRDPDSGLHTIIAGNRRAEAAQVAGLSEIPAMVTDRPGSEFILSVTENVQREDLSAIEEAEALEKLRQSPFNMKQAEAAQALGKSERWARERLRLLKLPPDVRQAMNERLIPLEASVHLERVAKGSERLADILVAEVRTDPDLGRDLVDANEVAARVRKVAKAAGLQPIASNQTFDPGTSITQIPISEEDRQRLTPMLEEIPADPYTGKRAGFKFGEADADAAKAYGCLLELDTDRHGWKETQRYITDPKWLAAHLESMLPAMAVDAAAKVAKAKSKSGSAGPGSETDDDKQASDDVKAERAKADRKAEKVKHVNEALVSNLLAMKTPTVGLNEVRMLAVAALGFLEELDWRVEQSLGQFDDRYKNVVNDVEKGEGDRPGEVLLREIAEAKSSGAVLRLVFRILATEVLTLDDHPRSLSLGEMSPSDQFDWAAVDLGCNIDEMVATLAVDMALLPEPTTKALARRRAKDVTRLEERRKAAEARKEGGKDA